MNAYEFILKMRDYATSGLRNVAQQLGVVDRQANQVNNRLRTTESVSRSLGNTLGGLKGKLIGLFAGFSLLAFTNQVIEARAEYEKFDAVLTNTFQNKDVGQGALALLTDFAAKTPYQLNELTGSFIKLVNRGVLPTRNELTALGDLASSQGKSFDQLTEGILDAQTGEFERMKEFGIKASKSGDSVSLTFKGITKTVKNSEEAIYGAVLAFGEMKGVAGSMDVISQTLGGRISNLKDQWWSFLVAVGGYSGGILGEFLGIVSEGLDFLKSNLPYVAHWFELLWRFLSPLVQTLKVFFKEAFQGVFGISDAKNALESFGNVAVGVLMFIDWLTTGLVQFIEWIRPIAPYLFDAAIAFGAFNLVMSLNPVGLIIIGIITLMTVIGMVTKYTDGWGASWVAVKDLFKAVWNQIGVSFDWYVEKFKYNFDMIILKAKEVAENVKNFFKSGDDVTNTASAEIEKRQAAWAAKQKEIFSQSANNAKTIVNSVKSIGITVDKDGISRDFKKIKDSFKGLGGDKMGDPKAYEDYLKNNKGMPKAPGMADDKKKKGKKDGDGIVAGGSKQMHIQININKLQDQTVIHVDSTQKGVEKLGDAIQEEILRAVNSVNQMQTI